jgi:subtilisin family serine protease
MKGLLMLALALGTFLLPLGARAQPAEHKLSPRLRMLIGGNPDLVESAMPHVHLKTAPEYAQPMVDALVRLHGDPKTLEAYGVIVRSIVGDVATVDIPLNALVLVANHPDVIRIEEARRLKPRLDVSVPASGANGVWGGSLARPLPPPWSGNTGRNVVVGLVDTGIDLKHADFKDGFGKSRILYVLDQNTGRECTKQQIDAGSCGEKDAEGHGTHVLGIAAGNGSATGNGQPAYRHIGMAPEANLIVVNSDFTESGILDGISYIEAKAAALGLPVVINLSLGGHFGPHDGTSNFEVGIDNASGAGRVIVVAAGNEAADHIHASGSVADNGSTTVGFHVPTTSDDVVLDLWYSGADQMGVKVTSPTASCVIPSSGFRYPGDPDLGVSTTCGRVGISTPAANSANGDHEILIGLQSGSTLDTGDWTFTLTGSGCAGPPPCITNGAFDAWVDDVTSSAVFNDHVDAAKTIGMPATATQAVAVGAHTTKTSWMSSVGPAVDGSPDTVGAITFFSSRGPRRTCSASNAICTAAVRKPELTAPGEEIMSSHAAGTPTAGVCFAPSNQCLDPDRLHIVFQGTSMATPHVTGGAALLLAKNKTLTADQVRTALEQAQADAFTGVVPNNTWGYGKLAVDLAIATVGANPPPGHVPAAPTGVAAKAGVGSAVISWTGIVNHIYLDGYNVYQSTASGGPYTKANTATLSVSSFKITGLTPDTPYYFVVRSLDTPDIESPDSMEVTATPLAPSGGGCGSITVGSPVPPSSAGGASFFVIVLLGPALIAAIRRRALAMGKR